MICPFLPTTPNTLFGPGSVRPCLEEGCRMWIGEDCAFAVIAKALAFPIPRTSDIKLASADDMKALTIQIVQGGKHGAHG